MQMFDTWLWHWYQPVPGTPHTSQQIMRKINMCAQTDVCSRLLQHGCLHGWSFANETPFAARTDTQFNYSLSFWWVIVTVPENKACPASSANLSELRHTLSLSPHHPWCMETVKWVLLMKMRKMTCSVTGADREWRQAWWRTKGVTGHTIFPLCFTELLSFFSFYLFSCHDLAATWGKRDPWGSGLVTSPA